MEQLTTKSITSAIEEFLWHCRFERGLDEKTIKAYHVDLFQFANTVGEDYYLKDITKLDIKRYLQDISHFRHKTIKRKVASLRAMLNYFECEEESYINPMRKMQIRMRENVRLPTVMNINELRDILHIVHKNVAQNTPYAAKTCIRNIAVIELLFATGMRVSELCNLQNKDVDMTQGTIRIIGKGNKERVIYVCQAETVSALVQWITAKSSNHAAECPFFINRLNRALSPQSVRHLVHELVRQAGLKKHITPHTFRHTLATLLLEEDVDIRYIQSILGHSSISTTQIYTHVNLNKQKEIFQIKHPRRHISHEMKN